MNSDKKLAIACLVMMLVLVGTFMLLNYGIRYMANHVEVTPAGICLTWNF